MEESCTGIGREQFVVSYTLSSTLCTGVMHQWRIFPVYSFNLYCSTTQTTLTVHEVIVPIQGTRAPLRTVGVKTHSVSAYSRRAPYLGSNCPDN